MKFRLLAAGLISLIIPASGHAQEACSVYVIQGGDSLRGIAQSAYGTGNFQVIFNANRNTIGSNPNNIEVGDELVLPCEDGSLPTEVAAVAPIVQPTAASAEASGANQNQGYVPTIKFLTGGNYAPFTDESLPGRGIFTQLVDTAMTRGAPNRDYSITFVNDWGAHLSALLPINAFDIGFPWYKPDCTKVDLLVPADAQRCTDFNWSEPVYELVTSQWTTPDNRFADAQSFSDLIGARICRAEGYSLFQISEEGLVEPDVTFMRPADPAECFEMLLDGRVDIVNVELDHAEGILAENGWQSQITDIPALTKLLTLSFLTHKSNPYGRAYIVLLNNGVREMRQSGEWLGIVSTGLADYARANQ